ncbi:MerR family transcriptional regulator [Listeria cornellensis]|nr:MerR family transcriptional regulator [Listeria cornellensis]
MDFVKEIMPLVIHGEITQALWKINEAQVKLHSEKQIVQHTIDILDPTVLLDMPKYKERKYFSIGEVAKEAAVSTSAIRHWEKEGLLRPSRNKESKFREFSVHDIRKIFIIRTVQRAVFSLGIVKEVLEGFDNNDISHTREIAVSILQHIDGILLEQIKGIASFNNLLNIVRQGTKI